MKLFAFGNPVYDDITTPVVTTHGRVLSGCSTNGCLALARLGRPVALVGRIGPDYLEQFQFDMARFGVESFTAPSEQTGGFKLVYDLRGDRTLDLLGVAGVIEHVPQECAAAKAIIIGPILQETPLALIEQIHSVSQASLFLDPQGLLRRFGADGRVEHFAPDDFCRIAAHCHLIKANELEAFVLTGIDPRVDPASAARRIREMGCRIAIVTLAEAGSFIDSGTQQWRIPAYATDARDPTGAGDTYMAGFLHAYLDDPADLFRAGCFGSATASIWIEHTGPEAPIEPAEVLRRARQLIERQSIA